VGCATADLLSTAVTTQILAGRTRPVQDSPSLERATSAGSAGTLAGQTSWTPADRPGSVVPVADGQPVPGQAKSQDPAHEWARRSPVS
jgi:hypothetical protein